MPLILLGARALVPQRAEYSVFLFQFFWVSPAFYSFQRRREDDMLSMDHAEFETLVSRQHLDKCYPQCRGVDGRRWEVTDHQQVGGR